MELTEAGMELLVKKLNGVIETELSKLSPLEISASANKIPNSKTMLDYRAERDDFLLKFNDPEPIPAVKSFTEEILAKSTKDIEIPQDSRETLKTFFTKEISRVNMLKQIVETRCANVPTIVKTHDAYVLFLDSISKYIFRCEEGLSRLQNTEKSPLTTHDLQLELEATFCSRNRKSFYKNLIQTMMNFPLTSRNQIYAKTFEAVQKYYEKDYKRTVVPMYPTTEADLDKILVHYAKCFEMDENVNSSDGQGFLYNADIKFKEFFKKLDIMQWPVKDVEIKPHYVEPDMNILTQKALLSDVALDIHLENIFKQLDYNEADAEKLCNNFVNNYNIDVGNMNHLQVVMRTLVPTHKISAFMKLRFTRTKYLFHSVLSMINYFEYIKYFMQNTKNPQYRLSNASKFPHILEIKEISTDTPVLFKSAIEKFEEMKSFLIRLCSHFTETVEAKQIEESKTEIINRWEIIERVLDLNLRYFVAKRSLMQVFLEVYFHTFNDKIVHIIYELIEEAPNLNIRTYHNPIAPYELAISLIEKKSKILRFLVNTQIMQERIIGTRLGDSIPLFDRPYLIPESGDQIKPFNESVPHTVFEVYMSLQKIEKFYKVVPKLALDFTEKVGIRHNKYASYMELAIWSQFDDVLHNIKKKVVFPYDQNLFEFNFPLSKPVDSLFNSLFVNKLDYGNSLITNMSESRKLRFMASMRRFFLYSWHLQDAIVRTDILQTAYYEQCRVLGIEESSVLMSPFMQVSNEEVIDLEAPTETKIIDFALSEFENVSIDFTDDSFIKDIIFAADFEILSRLITFQQLQNTILEIAIRYNSFVLDSSFVVNHFGLGSDADVFLTGAETDENRSDHMIKQIISMNMFYASTSLYRDNVMAKSLPPNYGTISIHHIKGKSRTILSAHAKQKEMQTSELFDLYRTEMLDSFAPFAYRIEIAKICNLERQALQLNSFIDTYILGPDPKIELVDNNGHFSKFMFLPTWVEVFKMLQEAPHARQSMILRSLLQYILARFRIFSLVKVEASLTQRSTQVFQSLYEEKFQLETPFFQRLQSKLLSLPDSQEVEICAKYMAEFERYFFLRFEFGVLQALEHFYVASGVDRPGVKVADALFGEKMKSLWLQMHENPIIIPGVNDSLKYIPQWEREYVYACVEADRDDLATRLKMVDKYVTDSLNIDDSFQNIPASMDFISLSITQTHMKFAYFLIINGVKLSDLTTRESIRLMTFDIYSKGLPEWDKSIVQKAVEHLAPKDESMSRLIRTIPETKTAQAIFDVVRNTIDTMMMSNQIENIHKQIDELTNMKHPTDLPGKEKIEIPKYDFEEDPKSIDEHFETEFKYIIAKLVEMNAKVAEESIIETSNGVRAFNSSLYEEKSATLSYLMHELTEKSLGSITSTWNRYITQDVATILANEKDDDKVDTVGELASKRFNLQTEATIGTKFHDKFIQLNILRNSVLSMKQKFVEEEHNIEKESRKEFITLIDDLKQQLFVRKNMFNGIKRDVYNEVFKKINEAKINATSINLKGDPNVDTDEAMKRAEIEHQNILKRIEHQNDQMRKKIIMMKVMKRLDEVAVSRTENKKIAQAEIERKEANAKLYQDKLEAQEREEKLETDLYNVHQKLCETELTIQKLKQMLENEKMSNIQLVHWKAKNMKVVEELNRQIKQFTDQSEIDIDALTERLEEAQAELEQLRKETDALEIEANKTVRKTISQIGQIRESKARSKSSMSITLRNTVQRPDIDFDLVAQRLSEDNIALKQENDYLRKQIAELEKNKKNRSPSTIQAMEEVTKPRVHSRMRSTMKKTPIIKPTVILKSMPRG